MSVDRDARRRIRFLSMRGAVLRFYQREADRYRRDWEDEMAAFDATLALNASWMRCHRRLIRATLLLIGLPDEQELRAETQTLWEEVDRPSPLEEYQQKRKELKHES